MSRSSWPLVESGKRLLFALAAVAFVWAVAIFLLGGFNARLLGIRVSSQSPYRAAMLALTCAAIAATLPVAESTPRRRRLRNWLRPELGVASAGIALLVAQWNAARPLWRDEEMIALNFRDRTLSELSQPLMFDQSAPFGWLVLERAVLLAFGPGELGLRLLPLLFGIGTLLCALWIGRRWMSPIGATVFALLCSFGQWLSFYGVELKHYSADAFGGLVLPALAVWVIEGDDREVPPRVALWGVVAAAVQWFSFGALLVMPACALFLMVALVRRRSIPPAAYLFGIGCLCAASFGAHYALALRHARESDYLQSFWQFAFPPATASVIERFTWLTDRLDDFAMKPGGTELPVLFWTSVAAGFVLTRRRLLGTIAATVVLSGFVFASLRLVPLFERLSLWFVPALYLGVALFADTAESYGRKSLGRRGWLFAAVTAAAAISTFQVCSDVLRHGVDDARNFRPPDSNRSTNDRSAVSWLMSRRRPGDALVTTKLGLPALLWYGKLPVTDTAILIAEHSSSDSECGAWRLPDRLKGHPRAMAYLGFQDFPVWFDDQLLQSLTERGSVSVMRHFGSMSRAAIVDLDGRASLTSGGPRWEDATRESTAELYGCVIAR